MFIQVLVILTQERLGPAFFLPKRVSTLLSLPPAPTNKQQTNPQFIKTKTYNYHPPMPTPDSEAPEQSLGDCAICMDTIIIDNPKKSKSMDELGIDLGAIPGRGGLLNAVQMRGGGRKNYSLAPCHHLFVSDHDSFALFDSGADRRLN